MKPVRKHALVRHPGVAGGGQVIAHVPMLAVQAGSPPDLVLTWNGMKTIPKAIDLVLHLHGYSQAGAAMNLATEKLPISGLDFGDPDRPPGATAARNRPTLCVLPRGRFFGGKTGAAYDFPVLSARPGCDRLVDLAVKHFQETAKIARPSIGRRILTAHSGGGAALMAVSAQFQPNEIHAFDALYADTPELAVWAEGAIARDAAALKGASHARISSYMSLRGHALRVFYIAQTGTEPASLAIAQIVSNALAAAGKLGHALAPWYRVESVAIDHVVMPRALGWQVLADAGAPVR